MRNIIVCMGPDSHRIAMMLRMLEEVAATTDVIVSPDDFYKVEVGHIEGLRIRLRQFDAPVARLKVQKPKLLITAVRPGRWVSLPKPRFDVHVAFSSICHPVQTRPANIRSASQRRQEKRRLWLQGVRAA